MRNVNTPTERELQLAREISDKASNESYVDQNGCIDQQMIASLIAAYRAELEAGVEQWKRTHISFTEQAEREQRMAAALGSAQQRIAALENAITRMKHLCNTGLAGGGVWGPEHIKMVRDEVVALALRPAPTDGEV